MKDILASFSRKLYVIPGGYYVYKLLSKIFPLTKNNAIKIIKTPCNFYIKTDISKYLGYKIYWRGAHDWNSILALKKFIQKDDVVIDIGANAGEYTLFAASFLNENGKVIAFEPVQKMFNELNENIQLNPHLKNKIIPIKKGIGNQKNILPIYDETGSTNEGLFSLHKNNFQHAKIIEEIEIDRLDNIIPQLGINKVDFIKIDVEGNELFALQGALEIIDKFHPKLMIEMSKKNFQAAGYNSSDIFQFLLNKNYSIYLILKRGLTKKLHSHDELPDFCNILAIHSTKS